MRLVLISVDSASSLDADALLSLPNISKLSKYGAMCTNVSTVYPTLTYPIHASIITGCYPDRHGISHNEIFDGSPPKFRPWYWEARQIQVPTLFTAAAAAGRDVAALLWPTTGKAPFIKFNLPEILAFPGENQALKVIKYGSRWPLIKSEIKYGKERQSFEQPYLDNYITLLAVKLIEKQYSKDIESKSDVSFSSRRRHKHMPDVLAIHLTELDSMRHKYGLNSQEEKSAFINIDKNIGLILAALTKQGCMEDTLVCVVSDHGQESVKDSINLNAVLKKYSVPARAQSLGFGAYFHIERANRTLVYNHLVQHMEEYKIAHVYSYKELNLMRAPKDVQLACEMLPNVEALDSKYVMPHKATHGFSPDSKSAAAMLFLMGSNIKRNIQLESANIVDVAPTLAKAIGLSLNSTDGRALDEVFIV